MMPPDDSPWSLISHAAEVLDEWRRHCARDGRSCFSSHTCLGIETGMLAETGS